LGVKEKTRIELIIFLRKKVFFVKEKLFFPVKILKENFL